MIILLGKVWIGHFIKIQFQEDAQWRKLMDW